MRLVTLTILRIVGWCGILGAIVFVFLAAHLQSFAMLYVAASAAVTGLLFFWCATVGSDVRRIADVMDPPRAVQRPSVRSSIDEPRRVRATTGGDVRRKFAKR